MTKIFLLLLFLAVPLQAQQDLAARAATTPVLPGDRVAVRIFREPELSAEVMVDVDGGLALPRLGTLATNGLTVQALHDTLRTRYAGFLRNPSFELSVLRRIVVNGEVAKPGVYFVDIGSTLRDAIALAGGVSDVGDPARVSVVRDGKELDEVHWQHRVTELRSGDQVLVGRRSWLSRNALAVASTATAMVSVIISTIILTR